MAKQSIHNRRAGRGSTGGGASWISYSDMMASLLLIFILILCYSLYHYFTMLDRKTAELEEQSVIVTNQKISLDKLQIELTTKQGELDSAQKSIESQEKELASIRIILGNKEKELDELQIILGNKETQLLEQEALLQSQAARLDEILGVRTNMIKDLSAALTASNLKAAVDPTSGNIMLESTVFFETGKSEIKEEGKNLLNQFIPVYLDVLLSDKYSPYLGSIIIEGHTDSSGTYDNNLKLSQQRALTVALYCLNLPTLNAEQKQKLQSILTATGRSEADLKYDEYGNEDSEASRRVEFKFTLRDSDMIREMGQILQESKITNQDNSPEVNE